MQRESRSLAWPVFKWALKLSAAAVVAALLAVAVLSIVLNHRQTASQCSFCVQADCVQVREYPEIQHLNALYIHNQLRG